MKAKLHAIDLHLAICVIPIVSLFIHGKLPYQLHIFGFFTLVVVLLTAKEYYSRPKELVKSFVRYSKLTIWYLLVFFFFAIAFAFDENKQKIIFNEAIYGFAIWMMFFFVSKRIRPKLSDSIVYFSVIYLIFCLLLLFIFYNTLFFDGKWLPVIYGERIDYNFFSFALIIAYTYIVFISSKFRSKWFKSLLLAYLLALIPPIALSGSRRGIILYGIITLLLLIGSIWGLCRKKNNKLINLYLVLILIIFLGLGFAFRASSLSFKSYIIENTFPNNYEWIKLKYSAINNRLTFNTEKEGQIKQYAKNEWKIPLYREKNWLDEIIFKKLKNGVHSYYIAGEYNRAFDKLFWLRNFSSSKEQFLSTIPDIYKSIIPETFLLNEELRLLPYIYSIPYNEKNFLIIESQNSLDVISNDYTDANGNDSWLFKKNGSNPSATFHFALLPNSMYELKIQYEQVQPFEFELVVLSQNGEVIEILEENDSIISEHVHVRKINFNSKGKKNEFGKIKILPNLNLGDEFVIGTSEYKRNPIELSANNDKDFKDFAEAYKKQFDNRYKKLDRYFQFFKLRDVAASNSELKEVEDFLHAAEDCQLQFYNRGFTKDEADNLILDDSINSRIMAVIPAIQGIEGHLEIKIKGIERFRVRYKPFPNSSPHQFSISERILEKKELGDEICHYVENLEVKSSTSGLAFVVLDSMNLGKGDTIKIDTFKFLTKKIAKNFAISKYQYGYLDQYIKGCSKRKKNGKINLDDDFELEEVQQFTVWKDSSAILNNSFDSRLARWKFAAEYFKDYSIIEKLFGKQFEYLKIYNIFNDTKKSRGNEYSYPHNPIISSFLYSGIIGGIAYLVFLFMVFRRYWLLRKELRLFAIIFLIGFYFTFFSGNSHFSVPAYTLLSLLPFAFDIRKDKNDEKEAIK